jgi:single-strand DNA-binding protein
MQNLNRWQGIGRLGRDPECKATQSGQTVAHFSIACQDDYKDKSGEKIERTEWVQIVMWGKGAEIFAKYAHKGSKVYIEGKLTTRKWQDQNGNDKYTTEVVANNFELLDSRGDGQQQAQQEARNYSQPKQESAQAGGGGFDDSDIPFAPMKNTW